MEPAMRQRLSPAFFRALQRGAGALLVIATAMVIVWSFAVVLGRAAHNLTADAHHKQITILHWGSAEEEQIVQTLCDRYTAAHPDVSIQRINASDMPSKLKTMMAAGTPPDLFYLPPELLPEMATLKLIRPVDDYVQKDVAAGRDQYLKDYYPILLDAFRYDTVSGRTGTGSLYALPKDFTTAGFYVNKDLFDAAGVPIPYGGWTWDEFEADMKKITALNGRPEFASRKIYGGDFEIWPATLHALLWTFGGDFFGKTFRDVTLDSPRSQQALAMIVRTRLKDHTVYNATGIAKDAGEEFMIGDIGCTGPLGRWKVPVFRDITKFKWDIVPIPYLTKADQTSPVFLTGWAMASAAKDPDTCFDLMKYLCGPEGAALQSRLGLAIPPLQSIANGPDFLDPPNIPHIHHQIFLDAIRYARIEQLPREPEWTRIVADLITRSIQLGQVSTLDNAHEIRDAWLKELDSPLRRQEWKPMNWPSVISVAAAVFVTIVFVLWLRARREKLGPLDRAQERSGFLFIAPWLLGFLCLTLGPMVVSLLLSFTKWTGMTPMADAQAVGLANYKQLLTNSPAFITSLRVTAYYVLLGVPVGQITALLVALLMNNSVRFIGTFRTIFFVPSVVSGVALAVLWRQIFNNDYGPLNQMLRPITHIFGLNPPDWLGRDANIFAIPAFVIMGLWGVGSGMIIYLAGLKGISASLYEAARIDGAGPLRRLWNVTLPMLSPLLFYNLVMGMIGSFQMFTQAYIMQGPNNSTLTYVLELYRQAFEYHNMGYASALAWVLFVIILAFTIIVFRGSKNLVYYEGLK
jgi:multiple sugar transport system permease protein